MTERTPMRSPGVRFPPPLLLVAGFVLGWLLETFVRRVHIVNAPPSVRALTVLGWFLLLAGLGLVAWAAATLIRHKTAIIPDKPAFTLVQAGPYRYSRNPIYAGFALAYVAVALLVNAVWPLLILPLALLALYRLVIRREERYLTDAFGPEYLAYQHRVRRWL